MDDHRPQVMAGPSGSRAERVERRRQLTDRVRVDLWKAVWEASQVMSYEEIRAHVEATIGEIVSDEP